MKEQKSQLGQAMAAYYTSPNRPVSIHVLELQCGNRNSILAIMDQKHNDRLANFTKKQGTSKYRYVTSTLTPAVCAEAQQMTAPEEASHHFALHYL